MWSVSSDVDETVRGARLLIENSMPHPASVLVAHAEGQLERAMAETPHEEDFWGAPIITQRTLMRQAELRQSTKALDALKAELERI
ncbi:MAG: hypothetical protein J4432_04450 [DPANN group archaeon]|nr:hypothetical protein [DPANN group archaeon]